MFQVKNIVPAMQMQAKNKLGKTWKNTRMLCQIHCLVQWNKNIKERETASYESKSSIVMQQHRKPGQVKHANRIKIRRKLTGSNNSLPMASTHVSKNIH